MSDVSRIEVKVGALIVVCVLLLVGFVFLLSDFQFGESSELQVDFDTSAGLKRGAPVKVSGLTAGRIEQVTFHGGKLDPELKRPVYVRVHLTIDPEIGATLKKDARFFITTIGLLGEKYVEIDPGESTEPLGTTIPLGVPPMRIEVLAANMNTFLAVGANLLKENRQAVKDTIDDVRAAVKSARHTVEEGREMVAQAKKQLNNIFERSDKVLAAGEAFLLEYTPGKGETGDHIKTVAQRGASVVTTLDSSVRPTAVRAIMGDVRAVTTRVRTVVDSVSGRVGRMVGKADRALTDASELLAVGKKEFAQVSTKVKTVLDGVNKLMDKIRDGEGTVGALLHDREMYDDAREMMKDLKRHPWKFLWKE